MRKLRELPADERAGEEFEADVRKAIRKLPLARWG